MDAYFCKLNTFIYNILLIYLFSPVIINFNLIVEAYILVCVHFILFTLVFCSFLLNCFNTHNNDEKTTPAIVLETEADPAAVLVCVC